MRTTAGHDNRNRWQTVDGSELAQEVWARLLEKKPLNDLPLSEHEGRVDLRGIAVPKVTQQELPPFRNWELHNLKGRLEFQNVCLENLDFSNSLLKHVQFFNSKIVGCRFDGADCEDWGVRATDVSHTTFMAANLRNAVLGPWYEGRGNRYEFVNFGHADLRGLISPSATYIDCDFSDARLDKIDFQSSSFIRCRFAGEVREVLFYDKAFNTKKSDPNPMEDVDFSRATLRWVEFRRLNLDRVLLPQNDDHLIIRNYRCVLQKVLSIVREREDICSRRLRAILELNLKWIGANQEIGVVCRLDFRESWGEEAEEWAVGLLRRAEQECSRLQ